MEISEHEFRGPFSEPENVSESHIGVYAVVCFVDDSPHCILDIGTSEGGTRADVTPTGNLRHRLKTQDRKDCWDENAHREIRYCVKHLNDTDERLGVESELRWKFAPPCGSDAFSDPEEFEDTHGEQGSFFL